MDQPSEVSAPEELLVTEDLVQTAIQIPLPSDSQTGIQFR